MNTKKILIIAFSVLFAGLLMVGCSSDDDPPAVAGDSGSTPPEENGGGSPPPESNGGGTTPPEGNGDDESAADTSRIQGDWVSECYGAEGGGGTVLALEFKKTTFNMALGTFTNNSCDQDPEKVSRFEGGYVFGKAITTSSGLSANELDLKPENEGEIQTLVAVDERMMTINFGNGKSRPSDFSDQQTTWDLKKVRDESSGSSGGSGGLSGDCEPCKSDRDCVSGAQCYIFEDTDGNELGTACALPETQSCPF